MDFKTLGSSLMNAFTESYEHSHGKQLREIMGLDVSSSSLTTDNIVYTSSSSMARQQSLEIYIDSIKLSDGALKILNGKYKKCVGIRICWVFMNYECTTPIIQATENVVRINDLQKHTITLNDVFMKYISKHTIQFELYGTYQNKEKHLGRSQLDVRNLLYCSEKDIFRELKIVSVNKNKFFKRCQNNNTIGSLTLKYCLKPITLTEVPRNFGELKLEELYYRLNQNVSSEQFIQDDDEIRNYLKIKKEPAIQYYNQNDIHLKVSLSDYCLIYDILSSIVDREEFCSLTKEEYYIRKRQKNKYLEKTIEEYAILSGTSPSLIASHTRDTIKIRNYDNICNYESVVMINVHSLHVHGHKFILKNNQVKELYVEYCFLSRCGKDMETLSLPLLENRIIEYNFRRRFLLDSSRNSSDCKLLAKMIKEKKSINFILIEEPMEEVNQFQICKEIGLAEVDLFNLIQAEDNIVTDLYPVKNMYNLDERIGYLKVSFYGVQAMRNTALKFLTPHTNKLESR